MLKPIKPYSTLLLTSYCALHQQKGWDRGGEWGHPQGAMHMAAAGLVVKGPWLTPGGPIDDGYMSRLRKHYSHLSNGSFLAGKTS